MGNGDIFSCHWRGGAPETSDAARHLTVHRPVPPGTFCSKMSGVTRLRNPAPRSSSNASLFSLSRHHASFLVVSQTCQALSPSRALTAAAVPSAWSHLSREDFPGPGFCWVLEALTAAPTLLFLRSSCSGLHLSVCLCDHPPDPLSHEPG